ncbi:hypothetical protein [Geobacter sp.]|uniref:hypothetical protein n=1 Tax=Geobacter sp. TaxID=46610 RepID=UPI002632D4F2|nr:hypothetical protein [Geobacter sp.]
MKVSELIDRLAYLRANHGEMEVFLDVSVHGLLEIGEIDVDVDDTGIIIWPQRGEEEAA